MASVRTERRFAQPRTPILRLDLRMLAMLIAACVGLFALSFALGRALSPGQRQTAALPEFAATKASAEIPVSLSAAPSLKQGTPVAAVVHVVRRVPQAPVVASTPLSAKPTPTIASVPTPQPSPTPVSTPPAAVVSPTPAKTPASTPSSGTSKPKQGGGGGVSFDSSG